MPSEDELRDGLRDLADGARAGTAADLWTARDRGRAQLRNRRLALSAVVLLALVGAVAAAVAADGDTPDIVAAPSTTVTLFTTTTSTTTEAPTTSVWTAPADDPTQPSPAAIAADKEFRVAPDDLLDCGVHVRTSGWPTTVIFGTDLQDCIADAAETGTPAQFVTTARDFSGGMEGTIFRVLGPSEILVIEYRADPLGEITSSEFSCVSLTLSNFPIPECI